MVPASTSGIDFNNNLIDDPLTDKNVLSYGHYFNGAGVGVADFNNDGLQDIFFAGNEVDNELYINQGDFRFEKLPKTAGINTNKVWSSGVCIVDINNDGFQDIYVSQQGPYTDPEQRRNCFYINNGDLTFTESAKEMGLDDPNYSTQAVFVDIDKDGDLDCYVLNESKYEGVILSAIYKDLEDPANMRAASGSLYENTGNLKFVDITAKAGVMEYGYGLGLSVSDFNEDNYPDIYVANDYSVPDFMFINNKDGSFKDSIKSFTRQLSYFGMGCDVGDINNDGLVDIGVVDMAAEDHFRDKTLMAGMDPEGFKYYFENLGYQYQYMFNSLQLNNGNNTFSNIAALAGVLKSDWSWAALFVDLDLDGYKDYYVSNGFRRYARDNDFRIELKKIRDANGGTVPLSMRAEVYNKLPQIKLVNKLYINDRNLHFKSDTSQFYHPDYPSYSYGVAYGDFDNDGDWDMVISNIDQEAMLLKNSTIENTSPNFLKIKLNAGDPAKELGSKVYIYSDKEVQLQEYIFIRGYESSMEQSLIFGLGQNEHVDSIKVVWADNNVQIIKNVVGNQLFQIDYQTGRQFNPINQNKNQVFTRLNNAALNIDFVHTENAFDDFATEILLPQKQTCFGPAVAIADVNNDGLEDIYFGGAKGQKSQMFVQNRDGSFSKTFDQPWEFEYIEEDVDAVFVDPNQDGKPDLLVASGGSGDFVGQTKHLQNRFYANLGNGKFAKVGNILPISTTASYAIIAENIDSDPEKELLVIGAAVPGRYPFSERTVLLDYQNQAYVDITDQMIPDLNHPGGLIRDAIWVDLNNDKQLDLVTVGEWQDVEIFIKTDKHYTRKTKEWKTNGITGWWRSIDYADLDGDGDQDLIIGNVGKNFKQKASQENPLYLYSNDFDENGTLDCVLAKNYKGKIVPTRGRQCSSEQMPFISEKFETYKDFASAQITDILGEKKIEEGVKLQATEFASGILWNQGNYFKFKKLPPLAQVSPVNDIMLEDFNHDNLPDILIIGNDYNTEYETPRLDAGNGLLLLNDGTHKFVPQTVVQSGLFCPGDAKKIRSLRWKERQLYVVANNNSEPEFFTGI